jgi:hypothetical protein
MHATDRGCSYPGCDAPGYQYEVHDVEQWATSHRTDIDGLTFACKPHHRAVALFKTGVTRTGWAAETMASATRWAR